MVEIYSLLPLTPHLEKKKKAEHSMKLNIESQAYRIFELEGT